MTGSFGWVRSASAGVASAFASLPDQLEEESTATSSTYELADGSLRSVVYSAPVNYRDTDGGWEPIDNALVASPGEVWAVLQNAANDYLVRLPADAGSTPVRFAVEGHWATMQLHSVDGAAQVAGAEATFSSSGGDPRQFKYRT